MRESEKGFTLVELSIVLVIIGLLIGGILAAQSMIQTAKIHSVIKQLTQYDIAFVNFQTRYNQLPGDSNLFPNPGNNNGSIDNNSSVYCYNEEFCSVWTHLSLGVDLKDSTGNSFPIANTTLGSAGICPRLNALDNKSSQCLQIYTEDRGLGFKTYYRDFYDTASLTPVDALSLDSKLDDGMPNSGRVISLSAGGATCLGGTAPNQNYNVTNSINDCEIFFEVGFSNGIQGAL